MKNSFYIALTILMCSACSKDTINQEMHEYIKTKEHDEALYGWWQLTSDPMQYILFEECDFKLVDGRLSDDGKFTTNHRGYYWYTDSGRLYTLRNATWKVGTTESYTDYQMSEDNMSILMLDAAGNYFVAYTKSELSITSGL